MFVRNGQRLGSLLVDKTSAGSEPPTPTHSEGAAQQRPDGVHSVGGGWHEVVVGGEVVEKIRGADAAREAYEALTRQGGAIASEVDDGDDTATA